MRDELLALLEDGPHPTAELAEWLGADPSDVAVVCGRLKDDGLLRRINLSGDRCWVLAGYIVPPASRIPRQPRTHRNNRRQEPAGTPAPTAIASPSGRPIRIINGEYFEVVNDCSGPVTAPWPGAAGESVFSGRGYKVSK